ncbi:class I SAM-dependent methyltransferase [Candidatus Woesearchaeota archaeon]|nr:class I SAM-dependent methyltransferase [Candidatus Woesearchaeota archaeon]
MTEIQNANNQDPVGFSLWYLHPRLYDLGMLLINGTFYLNIYKAIAAQIPENSSVLDVGAGPCTLSRYLKKSCRYEAWDTNPHFVRFSKKNGINIRAVNALEEPIPPQYDYIVLSGVLHHIHPHEKHLVGKCFAAAQKGLIIVEPFANPQQETRKIYRMLRDFRRKTFLERWVGEYDGRNHPDGIIIHSEKELLTFLDSFGKNTKTYIGDEILTVYSK